MEEFFEISVSYDITIYNLIINYLHNTYCGTESYGL